MTSWSREAPIATPWSWRWAAESSAIWPGFVAATFARGLPLIMVPTTLLAQVDSSVGGKVGVNHPRAKNMIGAFYQPLGVWIDTEMLETLPDREFRSGLAEVVKYGVICERAFFRFLEQNAERDSGTRDRRARANHPRELPDQGAAWSPATSARRARLGRCSILATRSAHAIEAVAGYDGAIPARRSRRRRHGRREPAGRAAGLDRADIVDRQVALLERFGLPVRCTGTRSRSSARAP